ncbi:CU044_5270 family protein [Streptomyces sp. NPDC001380]|uniref:CU044_5270 family protein n=1 Tax=Streptomyces sp. NPDC001380 TaxID=3364566 RepID=UPI0036C43127
MNPASGDRHARDEQREHLELARLLPPPPHQDMAPDRLRTSKEFLLNEIDRHHRPAAPAARRWGRLALATAAATAAAVAVVVGTQGGGAPGEKAPPATTASVQLLNRVAQVAYARSQAQPRDSQYTYVRTVGHSTSLSERSDGSMQRDTITQNREDWTPVDGDRPGLQRSSGGDREIPALHGGTLNSPTYKLLASLPTDPQALLKQIYADADLNHGAGSGSTTGPDQEAFTTIGDLLRSSVAPPQVSAALYRAAGHIPGVVTVDDAVDAAGRHGVAVARVHGGERSEWIFDRRSLRLLGERTVLLEDSSWGRAGDEVTSIAVVGRGIVDAAGQTPDARSNP